MSNYTDVMTTVVVVAVALAACAFDVRKGRIPNALTFGAAAAALVFHGTTSGFDGLQAGAVGWLVGTALFLPFFLLGGMGGGDVKLLAALGAWLGAGDAVWLAIYGSIAGGVMGVAFALTRGYLATALRNIGTLLTYWSVAGPRPLPALTLEGSAPRLAFAVPMFVGVMVTLWVR
jgi:prepilin peptidase CpaA